MPIESTELKEKLVTNSSLEESTLHSDALLKASRRRANYKSSKRFVRATELKDPTTLTPRDKALLRKHIQVIKRFDRQFAGTATAAKESSNQMNIEKSESEEEDATSTTLKQPIEKTQLGNSSRTNAETSKRPGPEETFNQECAKKENTSSIDRTPTELQIAIISRDHPDGKITTEHWLLVENEILMAMMEASENDSCEDLNFDGTEWREGVKVVCCGDHNSRNFLFRTIANIGELWEGCFLEILPATALPLRQKISVIIPPPATHEDSDILRLMAKQNKEIPILEWKLRYSFSCGYEGKYLFFKIDKKSDLLLKEKDDVLRYGLGILKIMRSGCNNESEAVCCANQPEYVQDLHLGGNVNAIKMECDGNYHDM